MKFERRFLPYAVAIGSTAIALLLTFSLEPFLHRTIGAFFYIAIIVTAWYGGYRSGSVTVVLSTLAINYWFIPPRYQFWTERPEDIFQLIIFVLVASLINFLTSNFRDRKQKIEQLNQKLVQQNAEQLQMVLSAAQMGMWNWNILTGEINWSPEQEQLFGLNPGTFDGKYSTFEACLHPDDREQLNQVLKQSISEKLPHQHEFRVVWTDGSIHWIEGRGKAFYDATGQAIRMMGTVMAIDERKQAQAMLEEKEALLRLFIQYVPAGIAMLDTDMRYVMASQRWLDEYNLGSIESLIHQSHYDIFPEIPERWRQIHQHCLAGAIEKSEEDLFIRENGSEQWIWWEIHPWYTAINEIGGIVIFSVDISNLKKTEIALRESQIQLKRQLAEIETIYQSAPIGLAVLDTKLRYTRINQRLAEINGVSVEAHIGRTVREIVPYLADTAEQLLQSIFETGKPVLNVEIIGETSAQPGVQRTWIESWLPLKDGEHIIGINIVCEEITDRKQTEIASKQLNAELEQRVLERTAELSQLNDRLQETLTALQESEERRRLALDLTRIGFWDMQLPSGYLVWNDIHFTLLGLDPVSIKPTRELWRTSVHPDDLGWVEQKFYESIENHTDFAAEHRVIHPDGSVHWLMSRAKSIYDELGQPVRVLGVLLDISDRKRTEQILELQAVITHNMAEGLCLVKADNAVIVYANPKFEQMFGYDSGELKGQHVSIVNYATQEVTAEDVNQAIRSTIFQNGEASYEVHNVKKDGTPFWCRATCSIFKHPDYGDVLVAVHQDITEAKHLEEVRQQAEQKLRQSEAKFRSLSDCSPVGIFMTDVQGLCVYTNRCYQKICDCTFEEALGEGWIQLVHSEDREPVITNWSKAVSQKQIFSDEIRYVHKDGIIRFGQVQSAPIVSVSGELIGYVGTVEDVTESKVIEKMKSEFISIVSHELRTPLSSIRGSLGLLAAGVFKNKPETAQQMLDIAIHDTERLVRLVNDILDLERLQSHKINLNQQWCDATTLLEQTVETVQSLAVQGQISLSVESKSVRVWADSDRIIQTLVNLVSNAIKFSPPQTTVTLSIKDRADRVLFQVQDRGRGIPADKLESIFERFQQVDASDSRQKGGTGLGLAICKTIVQQHGGKIWVESVLGEGSNFYFTLPKLLN